MDAHSTWSNVYDQRRRCTDLGLYDVFEPTFIRPALEAQEKCNLGHLIFGDEEWARLRGIPVDACLAADDPLTRLYRELASTGLSWVVLGGGTILNLHRQILGPQDNEPQARFL